MDRMKEAEAREVIRWEAEQHVPFDMDNVELDFQILDPEGEGLQMTVLLVAAKRELVEHKLALLSDVGLERQRHRRRRLRAAQRLRAQLPRGDARRGRPGQHRARDHQHQHPRRRRPGAHPRHPGRHPALPRGPAARARARRPTRPTRLLQGYDVAARRSSRCSRPRGEELAVGIERAAAFLQSASRSASGHRPDLHHRRRRPHSAAQPRCCRDRLRIPVQLANPIEKLQVADGVFDTMPVDEVAPLLMLPIGLALRTAA